MAAPNVNGRLHLSGVYQKPPASLLISYITEMNDESVVGADYFDDLFPLAEETGFEEQLDHGEIY